MLEYNGIATSLFIFGAVTLPQIYVHMWLSTALLGVKPPRFWTRLLKVSILPMVYMEAMYWILPVSLHLVNGLITSLLIHILMFKGQPIKKRILLWAFTYLLLIVSDSGCALAYMQFFEISTFAASPWYIKSLFYWPIFMLVALIAWHIHKRDLAPAARLGNSWLD
ncbi:hypothetical protein FHS18_000302 [Paenibacillus phyllosphaerae]|uniref:Uncharacterized protein n=1 Tax=Paenibacillus phyllosphaerae TaxID=274593 RepID=A0A7W5AT47_9BACL|nr:hypothetical protein [Paenibacillus phyllosphaerae]MBB3108274.1 hypothetical protein [Paenibacillus phyllosphaerae]